MGRNEIVEEMERVQADFHQLAGTATPEGLHRRSRGTRWSNRQLLFHMVFGYVVVRHCYPWSTPSADSDTAVGSLPPSNAGRRPFHLINYLGSCGGGQLLTTRARGRPARPHDRRPATQARNRDRRHPWP